MAVGDTYQVKFYCRHAQGQNSVNIRTWTVASGASPFPTMLTCVEAIIDRIGPPLKAAINNAWQFQGAKYRMLRPNPGIFAVTTHGAGPGVLIGESLPPQTSCLISLRATTARPRCRGRFYLPCPGKTESDPGGRLIPAQVTKLDQLGILLVSPFQVPSGGGGSATLNPIIDSKQKDKPDATFQLDVFLSRKSFATQRRRSLINKGDADEFA